LVSYQIDISIDTDILIISNIKCGTSLGKSENAGESENACGTENAGKGETAEVSVAMMDSSDGSKAYDLWFDTGATHHIVCDRKVVHELQDSHIESVLLGRWEKHPVLGQGKMIVEGGPSGTVKLNGALLVPSLKLNLCSGVQVTAKGQNVGRGGNR
jgi:hypothetical protein